MQVGSERGGGIFKNAAARVLDEERRLMTTGACRHHAWTKPRLP